MCLPIIVFLRNSLNFWDFDRFVLFGLPFICADAIFSVQEERLTREVIRNYAYFVV